MVGRPEEILRPETGKGDVVLVTRGESKAFALVRDANGSVLTLTVHEIEPGGKVNVMSYDNVRPLFYDNDGNPPYVVGTILVDGAPRKQREPLYWEPCYVSGASLGIPGGKPVAVAQLALSPIPSREAYSRPSPIERAKPVGVRKVGGGGGHGDGRPPGIGDEDLE